MSLSRQFFIIITVVFVSVFVSNFVISMQNTKAYIEEELSTKAKDTAVSLGMLLKKHIKNKKDPEIELTIKAIADSGFYNEVRLEDAFYSFVKTDLIYGNTDNLSINNIKEIWINSNDGQLIKNDEKSLEDSLNQLENIDALSQRNDNNSLFTFLPSKNFKINEKLRVYFKYENNGKIIELYQDIFLNNVLVRNIRNVKFDSIPSWFVSMIDFNIVEQKSEISDDWKLAAVIYVKPNPGIAYEKLYQQLTTSLLNALILFTIFMTFILIFVKVLLNPLKEIEEVAQKIAQCEFTKVTQTSWTKEFNSVSSVINTMSTKLENIINTLHNNISLANKRLNEDKLTKLEIKESFLSDIKALSYKKKEGYILLLKISNLSDFSKVNGRLTVNDFIIQFASIIKNVRNGKGYRFIGSEFALIIQDYSVEELNQLQSDLKIRFENLGKSFAKDDVVNIGITKFDKLSTIEGLLSALNEACSMAKLIGYNSSYIIADASQSKGSIEWNNLINSVIDDGRFEIDFNMYIHKMDTKNILMVETFSKIMDNEHKVVPIGSFISMAEENGRIIDFDKLVVTKIVHHIQNQTNNQKVILNLSIASLTDLGFLSWIENYFEEKENIASKLIFSISSYAISNHIEEFKKSIKILNSMGIDVMIKRYESRYVDTDKLKYLKPNIIKLAQNYTSKITEDENQILLVDFICKVTNILDIKVVIEGSVDDKLQEQLTQIGVYGYSCN